MQARILRQLHITTSSNCDHFSRRARQFVATSKDSRPIGQASYCKRNLKPLSAYQCTMCRTRSSSLRATASVAAAASMAKEGNPAARQHHPILDKINESTKWTVSAAVFSTLAARRDLIAAWWVLGSILAAVLCRALKLALNEARPPTARKADPGMPSSHANSLGFLAMFVSVWAANHGTAATGTGPFSLGAISSINTSPIVFLLTFGFSALGLFLTWLRVALGYHTVEQVAAGWLLGSSIAVGWWHLGIKKAIPILVQRTELQLVLYSITTVSIMFFILSNVLRWIQELGNIKK